MSFFINKRIYTIVFLSSPKFGQLILTKIMKIVATRCQILSPKCTKFDFDWGRISLEAPGGQSLMPWSRELWPWPQRSRPWPWQLHWQFFKQYGRLLVYNGMVRADRLCLIYTVKTNWATSNKEKITAKHKETCILDLVFVDISAILWITHHMSHGGVILANKGSST